MPLGPPGQITRPLHGLLNPFLLFGHTVISTRLGRQHHDDKAGGAPCQVMALGAHFSTGFPLFQASSF